MTTIGKLSGSALICSTACYHWKTKNTNHLKPRQHRTKWRNNDEHNDCALSRFLRLSLHSRLACECDSAADGCLILIKVRRGLDSGRKSCRLTLQITSYQNTTWEICYWSLEKSMQGEKCATALRRCGFYIHSTWVNLENEQTKKC